MGENVENVSLEELQKKEDSSFQISLHFLILH